MATREVLRASDADRDAVVDRLRAAASEGRLDTEELDARLHAALRARTYGQLDGLVDDLPGPHGVRRARPRTGLVAATRSTLAVLMPVLVTLAVVAAVVTAVALAAAWWAFWILVWIVMCGRGGCCSPRRLAAGLPRRRAMPARW